MVRKLLRLVLAFVGLVAAYVVVVLAHGTYTDFQPEAVIPLQIQGKSPLTTIADSNLTLATWNVGYCGLGAESDFFYDKGHFFFSGGMMVAPPEPLSTKNRKGVQDFLQSQPADFYLLQEVDVDSKRSFHQNQVDSFGKALPNYSYTAAINYNTPRMPLPLFEPWKAYGKVLGGLGTFSKYAPTAATRLQLPSSYPWPTRIFQLDRCLGVHRFNTAWGKELVLINIHNSAYDPGGKMKAVEMEFLKNLLLTEYKKGNYVICGGDWNQNPPNFQADALSNLKKEVDAEPTRADFLPDGWIWAFDAATPTNRSLVTPYHERESVVTVIDYFLISPNIMLKQVHGVNNEFTFSDHQSVIMDIVLQK